MDKLNQVLMWLQELNKNYPTQTICLGGVASYLYTKQHLGEEYLERTEDGDFLIEQNAFYELKKEKEVHDNPRMQMKRIYHQDVHFDIYVEYQNNLPLSFQNELQFTKTIDGIKTINLLTLIDLKLDTVSDRPKSLKNWRDLIKLMIIADQQSLQINFKQEKRIFLANNQNHVKVFFKNTHAPLIVDKVEKEWIKILFKNGINKKVLNNKIK